MEINGLIRNGFRILVSTALISTVVCTSTGKSNAEESDCNEKIKKIVAEFLNVDNNRYEKSENQKSLASIEIGDRGFDRTNGAWVRVHTRDAMIKVSVSSGEVVWALFYKNQPEEFPVKNQANDSASKEELRDEAVGISIEEAEAEAKAFLIAHFGPESFEKLALVRNELVSRGSHFAYYFVWREFERDGVEKEGMKLLTVTVNPRNGQIAEFLRSISTVDREVRIDAEQCRVVVLEKYGHLSQFRIDTVSLVSLKGENDREQPVWAVSYSYESPSGIRRGGCYVDADSGEILEQ